MGRFSAADVEHYGGQGGAGYFSLKNDKDTARVRFMYESVDDVEGYAVHEVMIGDKKRYVSCLRSYNEPVDNCPFCRAHKPQSVKLFVPVYNIDEDKVQVWERGKKFFQKLTSLCSRYPNLVSHVLEIERNGKSGSQTTTYEIYPDSEDNTTLADLPELPNILGGLVLEKSADDMEYYLENGQFPPDDEPPVRHRSEATTSQPRSERRTPASSGRSGREVF